MSIYIRYPATVGIGDVSSINSLTGAVNILAGTGIGVVTSGQNITISNTSASGANTTLSNLDSPTAINQDLLPDGDHTRSLGASGASFTNGYIQTLRDSIGSSSINLDNRTLKTGDGPGSTVANWATYPIFDMMSHPIQNLLDPMTNQDAATKKYVDDTVSGGTLTIGSLDSQSANANGLTIASTVLSTQSADATHPGMVNNTTQTFSGVKTFSSAINAGGNKITNGADPTNATDFSTKAYTDALVNGLSWKAIVRSATTTTLPSYTYNNGTSGVGATITGLVVGALPAQDGVTMIAGNRLLVKNEVAGNAPYNGIYTVTVLGSVGAAFVLTRSTDDNTSAEMNDATVEVGPEASTQGGFGYRQTTANPTMGTSAITWVNFTIGTAYTFTNGVKLVGSTVSADVDNSTIDITGTSLEVKTGGITNTQINSSAGIVDTKLATISTAGKVSNSATTAVSTNTASTIVARDASGNFSASTITASLTGNATNVTGIVALINGGTGTAAASANAAFNTLSPLTTKGDILGYDTVNNRIPVGTNGQVLTADSAQTLGLKWATPTTGTVTSVGMTVPTFLSVSGSPITTSGTLAVSLSGTALPLANGGTGQTTKAAAFDALSPMTTGGDLIYGGTSGTGTRLANGSAGQVLQSNGTTTAPTWTTNISGNAANVTGTVAIANGGTANTTLSHSTLTDAATVTWTVAGLVNNAQVTLGGNRTLAFSGAIDGMTGTLVVKQDATGSRTLALPSGSKVINGGGGAVTLTTTANAIDILAFYYDGTNYFWTAGRNYT